MQRTRISGIRNASSNLADLTTFMYEFKKIKNNHTALRDDVVKMQTCSPILIGQPVVLFGEGREFGTRMITTSPVVDIDFPHPNITRITTESKSIYEIKKL